MIEGIMPVLAVLVIFVPIAGFVIQQSIYEYRSGKATAMMFVLAVKSAKNWESNSALFKAMNSNAEETLVQLLKSNGASNPLVRGGSIIGDPLYLYSKYIRKETKIETELKEMDWKYVKDYEFGSKKLLLIGLFSVVYANGETTAEQRRLMEFLRINAFNFNENAFNKIEIMYWNRRRSGQYEIIGSREYSPYAQRQKNQKSSNLSLFVFSNLSSAYSTLGISSNCTNDALQQQWKRLALKCHPDRFASQGTKAIERATHRFQEISEAYERICRARGI